MNCKDVISLDWLQSMETGPIGNMCDAYFFVSDNLLLEQTPFDLLSQSIEYIDQNYPQLSKRFI